MYCAISLWVCYVFSRFSRSVSLFFLGWLTRWRGRPPTNCACVSSSHQCRRQRPWKCSIISFLGCIRSYSEAAVELLAGRGFATWRDGLVWPLVVFGANSHQSLGLVTMVISFLPTHSLSFTIYTCFEWWCWLWRVSGGLTQRHGRGATLWRTLVRRRVWWHYLVALLWGNTMIAMHSDCCCYGLVWYLRRWWVLLFHSNHNKQTRIHLGAKGNSWRRSEFDQT